MNEEELLQRAIEEREKLFIRYEQGREGGAEIDPWEDPGFEVYHTTDRYGFIHDKRLPSKIDLHEAKKLQIEVERQKKWLKMLKTWNLSLNLDKLHSRIYKGIPDSLRSIVWCKLLKVEESKNENCEVYMKMYNLAKEHSTDARQIDSDVNRQFREHLHYRERYSIKQQQLFNVLTSYAMYNSEVGYCQGMSGLAGVLLMYMDEEDAFWALHSLLTNPKYAMHGYYKDGFPKLTRFLAHHDKILTKFLPKLKKHFDKHGLDAVLYSLKWFFVCFIERVPFSLCLRVWDIHLLDGERVVTAMAYTILKLHKRNLLKLNDMDAIVNYIQVKLHKDFMLDDDTVIQSLEKSMEELKRAKLDTPGPPSKDEIPTRPFGVFKKPNIDEIVGKRSDKFSEPERKMNEHVVLTSDIARENADKEDTHTSESKFSFEHSNEDTSSLLDCEQNTMGSHRSLADTSVTSMADLSAFSTITRSQLQYENSLDTNSNLSDNSVGGVSSVSSGVIPTTSRMSIANTSPSFKSNKHSLSPDVLRIFVPYSPPSYDKNDVTPIASPHNNTDLQQNKYCLFNDNKIVRIRIDNMSSDELQTPLVEHGQIKSFDITDEYMDLK